MAVVKARPGDTADIMIKKFIRKVINEGILSEMKKKEFYQKPSEIRKEIKATLKHRRIQLRKKK